MKYADVIVPLAVFGTFTYSVPKEMEKEIETGKRVLVQFGKRKIYTAIVKKIHTEKPDYDVKDIVSVIDDFPVIEEKHFEFWEWLEKYYIATPGDVFTAAVPVSMRIESQTAVTLIKNEIDENELSEKELIIIAALKQQKTITISSIGKILSVKNPVIHVNKLLKKGIVEVYEHLRKKYKPKFEKVIRFSQSISNENDLLSAAEKLKRAKKQFDVFLSFLHLTGIDVDYGNIRNASVQKKLLLKESGANSQQIKALVEKGIFDEVEIEVSRLRDFTNENIEFKSLSDAQRKVFSCIKANFKQKNAVLVYGVTSSGKTEIYIHLIREFVEKGKQVLYLLPEIALTSQIINRLRAAFGNRVGVYHSKFNDAERAEIWNRIGKNAKPDEKYDIILGVRSAVLLPFDDLGLIIVDEEHENTYKQFDPSPRYNARDAALMLARIFDAKVLLGTATPSVESFYNAMTGKYGYCELTVRYGNVKLPEIVLADIRQAKKNQQMKSVFHPLLVDEMRNALDAGKQVILFRNRRGFSPYVECGKCGWIPKCENCDVSLTYHIHSNELVCHYCGYRRTIPHSCDLCGEDALETRGFGTQRVEDDVSIFFPDAKVERLDLDIAKKKYGYEMVLGRFDNGETDILIGTQMITKGLDFENVQVVGVLNADNLLNFPDFRSFERSYQLLTQVSGRAGRVSGTGKVIIQTTKPHHKILKYVRKNDFKSFFYGEIEERKVFGYPPFRKLIKITIKHKDEKIVKSFSRDYATLLRKQLKRMVLGPQEPVIARIQSYYLREILLKLNDKKVSLSKTKVFIRQTGDFLKSQKNYSTVKIVYDVDPY